MKSITIFCRISSLIFIVLILVVNTGCSILKPAPITDQTFNFNDQYDRIEIEQGQTHPLIERVREAKNSITRWLPGGAEMQQSPPSVDTVATAVDYLSKNDLHDVKVRVSQYDPRGDWQRLKDNQQIAAPVRYTLGAMSVLKETIMPGVMTGRDSYNPFTNTISLNSDRPALAVEQAAYAREVRTRKHPELYLIAQKIPGGELPKIMRPKQEVVNYFAMYGSPVQQQKARTVLVPKLFSEVGGEIGDFIPSTGPVFSMAGRAVGNVVARQRR